jgi:hypothetical protein
MSAPVAPHPVAPPPGPRSLKEAVPRFFHDRGTKLIVACLLVASAGRLYVGDYLVWDALLPPLLLLLQPFVEWGVHVHYLHMRPRKVFGFTLDPLAARLHRAHHKEPWNVELGFMPFPVLVRLLIGEALFWPLVMPTPALALTGAVSTFALTLYYEWIHFLVHTPYLPKGAFYREQWRLHRLHHHKNERYWMGVTLHLGDRLLGTQPDPATVESSPSVRDLALAWQAAEGADGGTGG